MRCLSYLCVCRGRGEDRLMLSPAVLWSEWTVLGCRLASALNTVPPQRFSSVGGWQLISCI